MGKWRFLLQQYQQYFRSKPTNNEWVPQRTDHKLYHGVILIVPLSKIDNIALLRPEQYEVETSRLIPTGLSQVKVR